MRITFTITPHTEPYALMNHIFKAIGLNNSGKTRCTLLGIQSITCSFGEKTNKSFQFSHNHELEVLDIFCDGNKFCTVRQHNELGVFPNTPDATIKELSKSL